MISKLLFVILVFHPTFSKDASDGYATNARDFPFLALIKVESKGKEYYFNGVFVSLKWVMGDSNELANCPETPHPLTHNTTFTVYGGFSSFDQIGSAPNRKVIRIVTEVVGNDNKYFPNLVLFRVESAFPRSDSLRPAVFNIGKLSLKSITVGWVMDLETKKILNHPVSFPVKCMTSKQCTRYNLVEFKEQFCTISANPMDENFRPYEGALLVDQNQYVTGILQFSSYLRPDPKYTPIMILVRLSYFKTFWEFYVPTSEDKFLDTNFKDDDLQAAPWFIKKASGGGLLLFSLWTWILNTSLLFLLFFLTRHHNFLLS